ncbi:type IV secretion system protein [Bartonella sp. AU18XJBT]|uniref:type IV secretion system protein n=1 Tax=Bartonella sp. AU18XJBT TaxID=3019089 RepID=UPI002362B408|nr:type IV secretion system protein [Bartonella sp. AU18XJBT]
MKKILIITGIIMFFGMPRLAMSFIGQDENVMAANSSSLKENPELIELLKKQLDNTKAHLQQITKIHESITGRRIPNAVMKNDDDLLLTEPQHIYDENKEETIDPKFPQLIADIRKQEEYSAKSIHEIRALIDLRSQYASIMDKVVSLQVFEETEERFLRIAQYLMALKDTQDLKAVVEVQAHIKGMHAMVQNEATKLQMVAHLRNAEQTLIRQQKYKRNIRILNHKNKGMPQVRYASATQ